MSIEIKILCDDCDCTYGERFSTQGKLDLRQRAKARGWTYALDEKRTMCVDRCPKCSAAGRASASQCNEHLRAKNERIAELEALPCDSPAANEWINKHAPREVIEALWAWTRISTNGLAKHKATIDEQYDYVLRLESDLAQQNETIRIMGIKYEELARGQ